VAVPNEVFYGDRSAGRHLVRFSFAKRHEVLHEAVDRLAALDAAATPATAAGGARAAGGSAS